MKVFGKEFIINTPHDLEHVYIRAHELKSLSQNIPVSEIIEVLDKVKDLWKKDKAYYNQAKDYLTNEVSFHPKMIELTLDIIPDLLKKEILLERVNSEFQNSLILDHYIARESFQGKVKAFARGVATHVSAGNVFLGCIDSLLMGILTKNINILKLSSNNQFFPILFLKSIEEVDLDKKIIPFISMVHWRGGDDKFETIVKKYSDTILAWGGEQMVRTYKENQSLTCKLLDFGPKISIQIITRSGLEKNNLKDTANAIIKEFTLWDQHACANAQNLFLENGADLNLLLAAIKEEMPKHIPRGKLSDDEYVELLKEKALGVYDATEGHQELIGDDYYIREDNNLNLRPSPLNRTLLIKRFESLEQLFKELEKHQFYLQSCSILGNNQEEDILLNTLPILGIKRIAPLGKMLDGLNGAPHDGRYILTEMVQFIPWEKTQDNIAIINEIIHETEFYAQKIKQPISTIQQLPLTSSKDYVEYALHHSDKLLNHRANQGYFFSSGGTSGSPKFVFYTHDEFQVIGEMLAIGLKAQGLKENQLVANLFAAGNMWSSFMAIDIALEKCKAKVLPIGGLCPIADIVNYLKMFKVKTIFGLPSLIAEYANYCHEHNINLEIETIFFAGEQFYNHTQNFITKIWGTKNFRSAGYASVDAGLIGYQTPDCKYGEHYLFSKYVNLEIIDGQGVVTSLFRKSMPVLRYQTGDEIELINNFNNGDQKFKLKGRIDDLINLWSCKINLREFEVAIDHLNSTYLNFQIELKIDSQGKEIFVLTIETLDKTLTKNDLADKLHQFCHDINQTLSIEYLVKHIEINFVEPGKIPRVARTGKIKILNDLR